MESTHQYACFFVKGNDDSTVPDDRGELLRYLYKHNLIAPLLHVLSASDPGGDAPDAARYKHKTFSNVMQCVAAKTWSILCVCRTLLENARRCILDCQLHVLFQPTEGPGCTTCAGRWQQPAFWIRDATQMCKHMQQNEDSLYVPVFSLFPNLFTPYVRNMMQDNAAVFGSVNAIVDNVKLLDTFFEEWVDNNMSSAYSKTSVKFKHIQRAQQDRGADDVVAAFKCLVREHANYLYQSREPYDQGFFKNCITNTICHGFFTYTLVDRRQNDAVDGRTTHVRDVRGNRVAVPHSLSNATLTPYFNMSDTEDFCDCGRDIAEGIGSDPDDARVGSYRRIFEKLQDTFTSAVVPMFVPARVVLQHGMLHRYCAFDADDNPIEVVFGEDAFLPMTDVAIGDMVSPLTKVINKYCAVEELIRNVGLSFYYESKPLVLTVPNASSETDRGLELRKELQQRHKEFAATGVKEQDVLLKYDSTINHLYLKQDLLKQDSFSKMAKISTKVVRDFEKQTEQAIQQATRLVQEQGAAQEPTPSGPDRTATADNSMFMMDDDDDGQCWDRQEQEDTASQSNRARLDGWRKSMDKMVQGLSADAQRLAQKLESGLTDVQNTYVTKNTDALRRMDPVSVPVDDAGGALLNNQFHSIIRRSKVERHVNHATESLLYYMLMQGMRGPMADLVTRFYSVVTDCQKADVHVAEQQLESIRKEIEQMKESGRPHVHGDGKGRGDRDRDGCTRCQMNRLVRLRNTVCPETASVERPVGAGLLSSNHARVGATSMGMHPDAIDASVSNISPPCPHDDNTVSVASTPSLCRYNGYHILKLMMESVNTDIVTSITGKQPVSNRQEIVNTSFRTTHIPQSEEVVNRSLSHIKHIARSVYGRVVQLNMHGAVDPLQPTNVYHISFRATTEKPVNDKLTTDDVLFWQQFVADDKKADMVAAYLNVRREYIDSETVQLYHREARNGSRLARPKEREEEEEEEGEGERVPTKRHRTR